MDAIGQSTHSLESIAIQHRGLKERIDGLCQLMCNPTDRFFFADAFFKVKLQLGELRDFMKYHFAQEASGGYLEDAVVRLPRLGVSADVIEREHPLLLREIEALIERAGNTTHSLEEWRQFREGITVFARKLTAHEAAENRILQLGFNEDPSLFE